MRVKILLLFVIGFFMFTSDVSAAICDKEHVNQLKELAKQVEISYEYLDYSDEMHNSGDGEYIINSYLITINLISDELYVIHENREYYYNQDNGGIVSFSVNSGRVDLSVNSYTCAGYQLRSETINLPKFNTYSYRGECKELEEYDLDVCDPWYQGTITDDRFNKIVQEYLTPDEVAEENVFDKILSFFKDNYLFIIGGVVIVGILIVGIIFYRKRSVLE